MCDRVGLMRPTGDLTLTCSWLMVCNCAEYVDEMYFGSILTSKYSGLRAELTESAPPKYSTDSDMILKKASWAGKPARFSMRTPLTFTAVLLRRSVNWMLTPISFGRR